MRTRETIVGNWGSSKVNRRLPQGRAADGRPNLASAIFTTAQMKKQASSRMWLFFCPAARRAPKFVPVVFRR